MLEQRASTGLKTNGNRVTGYAAVFDCVADIGTFKEIIRRGAFSQTLNAASNIRALAYHDDKALLGTTQAGTLTLREDDKGLAFELDLPDTTHGRDIAELVKRGDIAGCSFGFHATKENWAGELRELIEIELIEITLTPTPAYSPTSVSLRSKQKPSLKRLWIETL